VRVPGGRLIIAATSTASSFGETTPPAYRSRSRRRSRPPRELGPQPVVPQLRTLTVLVADVEQPLSLTAFRQLLELGPYANAVPVATCSPWEIVGCSRGLEQRHLIHAAPGRLAVRSVLVRDARLACSTSSPNASRRWS
jgi:hypothetical protein